MKKTLLTSIIAGALFLLPALAHATTGYVCEVEEYNYSGFGNNGGLLIEFTSGPHCTGSFQFVSYVCTTGGFSSVCTSNAYYLRSEAQLMAIFHELAESGRSGNQIAYFMTTPCMSSGTSCLQDVDIFSD